MTFDEILRDFDLDSEDVPLWEVERPIWTLAAQDPDGLFATAVSHLDDDDRSAKYLAAVAIGRTSEHGTEELARQAEGLLVNALRAAPDRQVAEGVVNALNHAWCRLGDEDDYRRQFELALDANPNCRLAAAQFFALSTGDPPPLDVEQALGRLAQDDDEEVRWWATEGRRVDDDET